jgi:hypothetical protein
LHSFQTLNARHLCSKPNQERSRRMSL